MNEMQREKVIFSDVDEWLDFINNLEEPQNDIERTRNHYLCVIHFVDKFELFIKNVISFPAILFSLLGTFLKGIVDRLSERREEYACEAVMFRVDKNTVSSGEKWGIPDDLKAEYPLIKSYIQPKGRTLLFTDTLDRYSFKFWLGYVKTYPFAFYMNLSLLMHLNAISKIVYLYKPKIIITMETENDFTTSFLTEYCEKRNIEYIGIMHGENFVNPLHAFVRFSRFYVWDAYYIEQYIKTGSEREFFRVYTPLRYQLKLKEEYHQYYITYYLQGQDEVQLQRIYKTLMLFSKKGLRCKIRMHPRATDKKLVKKIFSDSQIEIENYNIVSIEESYKSTEYVVSMYSTVLTEAYQNGIKAAVDDVTDVNLYHNLEKMMYINLERINLRLSMLLSEIGA